MKAVSASLTKCLTQKTQLFASDNSGAKKVEIMSVFGHHTRKRMNPKAGIGDMVNVAVQTGKPEMRKTIEKAIVVRVRKEYRRANGMRIKFEDNAVVLVDEKGQPKGTEIKGVVAKEVGERWPKIAGLASAVV